jgi:hypothetical protein
MKSICLDCFLFAETEMPKMVFFEKEPRGLQKAGQAQPTRPFAFGLGTQSQSLQEACKGLPVLMAVDGWFWVCGPPKDVHILVLGTCEYVTFHGKRDFGALTRFRMAGFQHYDVTRVPIRVRQASRRGTRRSV